MIWRRTGLVPTPLVESVALHVLALASIAWLGSMTGATLAPPKLVTVEIVTAPPPPAPPPKPVARAIAAVKHALVPNRAPKVVPTPTSAPPPPAPEPTPVPEAKPEPVAPPTKAETPSTVPTAGTETFKGSDVDLGRGGATGGKAGQSLAAVGPSSSALGAEGSGTLTSFAIPKGGYQMKPVYPESARRAGIEGTSLLRFEINEQGMVSKVTVEKSAGHEELDRAAVAAIQRWRFEPARRGSQAVAVWVTLPIRFELKKP